MKLQELVNQLDLEYDWQESYKKNVPLFIQEAATGKDWQEWNPDVFHEFFERSRNQSVSSLPATGYFTTEDRKNIKDHWGEIAPVLSRIANNQDVPSFESYNELLSVIIKYTKRQMRASVYRMIAGLQPKLLTTIVNHNNLNDLFYYMKRAQIEGLPNSTGDWFKDSHAMMLFFRTELNDFERLELATYPWQIKELLASSEVNTASENEEQIKNVFDKETDMLRSSHNLILNGAPGTGKTYLAQKIAEELVKEKGGDITKNIARVQFHPSYDYTDFVEGLRPIKSGSDSTIGFERKDGEFKKFCAQAKANYIASITSKEELDEQRQSRQRVDAFLEIAIEHETVINKSTRNSTFRVLISDDEDKIKVWSADVRGEYFEFPKQQLYDCYDKNKIWDTSKEMWFEVYGKTQTQQATYILNIIKEIKKQKFNTKVESISQKVNQENFVFIIDEINRGEISKIFGELFLSIEPSYRGEKGAVKTQYQNLIEESNTFYKHFYIPENVYIIGTMNDIDRSVESMDFAMRRRFTFHEIKATDRLSMWDETLASIPAHVKEEAKTRLVNLNNEIENIQGLNDSYHIGPAYFNHLKEDKLNGDFDKLWTLHISPLLKEYVRGMHNSTELMGTLKQAYDTVTND